MRGSDGFLLFSIMLTVVLFAICHTPAILYLGLLYSLMLVLSKDRIREKQVIPDRHTALGILLIVLSPIFLIFKIGENPSPATFHAFVLIGTSLILFQPMSMLGPNSIAAIEALLAMSVRMGSVSSLINGTSRLFVDVTSYVVRALIGIFNLPISMEGNIAVVRNSIIVIGSGCSGLDAFVLYLIAAISLIYLRKSDGKEAALLIIGSLGIIPLNALRIFSLLVIGYYSGISFLELFHSHLGDLMFLAYVYGYWWWVIKRGK